MYYCNSCETEIKNEDMFFSKESDKNICPLCASNNVAYDGDDLPEDGNSDYYDDSKVWAE